MLLTSVCVLCVQNCFNELQEIIRVMLKYLGGWGGGGGGGGGDYVAI